MKTDIFLNIKKSAEYIQKRWVCGLLFFFF